MTKIYCHINQCNASVQYFAILHNFRETYKTKKKKKDKKIDNILYYHMAKICCHINQCSASVQYFAIMQMLHDFRENSKTRNTFTLTFIRKGKCCSMMRQILRQIAYVHDHATKSLFCTTKIFSHMMKLLLHQCHKILALCNIKIELAGQQATSVVLMQ